MSVTSNLLGLVERPVLGNGHAGCGRRFGETHRWKPRQGAPNRPHLVLATVGLLKSSRHAERRVRLAAWLAFGLGIAVSLVANIASAPTLAWQPVLVAGWPPVALLLAVELLAHTPQHREQHETDDLAPVRDQDETSRPPSSENVMWEHFLREQARGRTPSGAELDRVAGTNNFGRAVLRRWRRDGRIPPAMVLRLGSRPTTTNTPDQDEEISS